MAVAYLVVPNLSISILASWLIGSVHPGTNITMCGSKESARKQQKTNNTPKSQMRILLGVQLKKSLGKKNVCSLFWVNKTKKRQKSKVYKYSESKNNLNG